MQTKFRDEPRPKSGLLRVREFTMKDSYSLDLDREGLDRAFQLHFDAYRRIFERCGLQPLAVEASSGAMGGSESIEFMVPSDAGEDWVASCGACGYAANVEKATSQLAPVEDAAGPAAPEKFATPGVRTIEALASFAGGAPAERQVKTLVYVARRRDRARAAARGPRPLRAEAGRRRRRASPCAPPATPRSAPRSAPRPAASAPSACRGRGCWRTWRCRAAGTWSPAPTRTASTCAAWTSGGTSRCRRGWTCGVAAGEACPLCASPLAVEKTIEVGHIFKLGTRYSEALGATVLDEQGRSTPIVMGSYGIGIGRVAAAIVERCHDEAGIVWPVNVAPYEVVVTVLNPKEVETSEAGERIYDALRAPASTCCSTTATSGPA
jgi:prolyl-tRNA synthetase